MSEAAAAAAPSAPPAAPSTGTPSAGATLSSVPAGPDWAASFKEETRGYISQKGFKSAEALAESYRNLETKLSSRPPEDRTLVLPEKMEGADARAVWERLGAPKEAKGYEITRDEKSDKGFVDWAESAFHQNNLTKGQAQGLAKAYNDMMQSQSQARAEMVKNAIAQADVKLQTEWGANYEKNLNIAKQGAKILGLDAKTLDTMESIQGREALFKTLQKIGLSVGESNFVDGQAGAQTTTTPEQAQTRIRELMQDAKFVKKVNRGDAEALKTWNDLNRLASPGEKTIG